MATRQSLLIGVYGGQHQPLNIGERNFGEVYEHMLLLKNSGLAEVRDFGRNFSGPVGVAVDRLTMAGHDFLEAARNDNAWNKAKEAAKKVGGMSVDVFKKVLIGFIEAEVKKHTGLDY